MSLFRQLLLVILCDLSYQILLINEHPSNIHYSYYTIVSSSSRQRREKFWLTSNEKNPIEYPPNNRPFYPSLNVDETKTNSDGCDPDVYDKLHSCSLLTECIALSSCLKSIKCPLATGSRGNLIFNLIHVLGVLNCDVNDSDQSCPHEKRSLLLQIFLTHWTNDRLAMVTTETDFFGRSSNERNILENEKYCSTIPRIINETIKEIEQYCPASVQQVEIYLEYYSCSGAMEGKKKIKSATILSLINTTSMISTKLSQVLSATTKIDEDTELDFINSNKDLGNTTEQQVFVNDHQYYNVSYIIPRSDGIITNFIRDNNNAFTRIHALSNRHQSAFGVGLKFGFPFYGHIINKILIATGGFIYTGDLLHSALIGSTQYIAPFMANFDVSLGDGDSEIKYFDNGTHFICTWNNLYLQDQQTAGPFTFQAILQNTGNIYFNYARIPQVQISIKNHAHRIGLSDAYMVQRATNEHIVRVITLYDKLNLDKNKIKTGVSVVFEMDNTCNTFLDCHACLTNRGKRYNCSWCDDIQKCSDGYDRSRHQWIQAQCHHIASQDICPNSIEEFDDNKEQFSSPKVNLQTEQIKPLLASRRQHSIYRTFRTVVITLLLSVLILSLIAFGVTYLYAYRHPTSPPGLWLLEHRPSNYIARFKRFSGSNTVET